MGYDYKKRREMEHTENYGIRGPEPTMCSAKISRIEKHL